MSFNNDFPPKNFEINNEILLLQQQIKSLKERNNIRQFSHDDLADLLYQCEIMQNDVDELKKLGSDMSTRVSSMNQESRNLEDETSTFLRGFELRRSRTVDDFSSQKEDEARFSLRGSPLLDEMAVKLDARTKRVEEANRPQMSSALRESGANLASLVVLTDPTSAIKIPRASEFVDLEELKKRKGVDPTLDQSRLEMYLNDEQFYQVFKLKREEFYLLQRWQQERKRKAGGLF